MPTGPKLETLLCCPRDCTPLAAASTGTLECRNCACYPVIEGVPILLREDDAPTIPAAAESLRSAARGRSSGPALFLETLGVDDEEREAIEILARNSDSKVDPV